MSLKDDIIADLSVFYNADEFAKKCIYKGNEVAVLYRKNDIEMFEVNFESIKARKVDFEGLEEGDVLEIEGVSYTVMNFSPEKDFQISISIKEK